MSTFFFSVCRLLLSAISVRSYIEFGVEFIKWHKMNLCAIIIERSSYCIQQNLWKREMNDFRATHRTMAQEKKKTESGKKRLEWR